ncbi:MAG: galactose oxidase-like domain-containing protein [Gemmatimonadales bacterium]
MIRYRQIRVWSLALLLALASLRCNGGNIEPTTATNIEMVDGNQQTWAAGQPLPNPLVVVATDASGNAVPGVEVHWAVQGGGSVSAETVETGSSGRASVQRVLGPEPGQQTTTATVAGLQGSPVTFVATATEGGPPPGTIAITTNPPTSALDREVFHPSVQPALLVKDGSGSPAAGAEVTASIASGGGVLQGGTTATTDANGVARFGDLGIEGTGEHTLEFAAGTATVTSSPVNVSALPPEASKGEWGPLVQWDIVPLHMSLMPNGNIVAWGKTDVADTMGMPRIWNPALGPPSGARMIDTDSMLFCAGHTLMPDGRLMASGGHLMDDRGTATTYFFTPDGSVQKGPNMAHARWYPTVTVLENGRVLTMGGRDEANKVVTTPEIWENGDWVPLTGAGTLNIPYYPRNFVDPKNGLIFYAGERVQSRWFDVDGSSAGGRGAWIPGPSHVWRNNRDYGSAVMYEAGKILYVGGGGNANWRQAPDDPKVNTPTATAETIDLNATVPTWQYTGAMAFPRRHLNATILPDGQVLVTGGTRGGGKLVDFSEANAVHEAEIWNPTTGQWTTLDRNSIVRVYHSVSLLLPDGTVLHGSSGDAMDGSAVVPPQRNHEIFSPPYLFKGARPAIASAPGSVGYGQTFSVATPNAAQITEVRWIRLGSVTHAFDASARANTLSFEISGGNVEVTAPSGPRLAPPGHYLLFILNRNGVPSEGKVVRVQ